MKNEKRILSLTLVKSSFDIMVSGEKNIEYRNATKWILSRLNKSYDDVKFVNGYGRNRPFFTAKFVKWDFAEKNETITYSNGHKVYIKTGMIMIFLGNIIDVGNL